MTKSPRMITLFSEMSESGGRPTSVALSVVLHGFLGFILWFSITYRPPIRHIDNDRVSLRELDLFSPDEEKAHSAAIPYPEVKALDPARKSPSAGKVGSADAHTLTTPSPAAPPTPKLAAAAPAPAPPPPQIENVKTGPQTLIQADLPKTIALKDEIPVPQVIIWSPAKTPVTKITPPAPEKPAIADAKPSLAKPTTETFVADINLAASERPMLTQPLTASTTTPISSPEKQAAPLPPVAAPQPKNTPTPAAILSLSDLRIKSTTAMLPAVSEAAASKTPAPPAPVQSKSGTSGSGTATASNTPGTSASTNAKPGTAPSSSAANSAGKNVAPKSPGALSTASAGNGSGNSPQAKTNGAGSSPSPGNSGSKPQVIAFPAELSAALNSEGHPAYTQIDMPRDGHFGAVVFGNSLEDQYPEIAGVWQGRVAYTAYLHVGLSKNWILQYSVPRIQEMSSGGSVAHLEAPWPYNIVRPNLTTGSLDADALLIHGFINASGKFEAMRVVFPGSFPQAQFVLTALQQWLFRPAQQDGQATRVEVLLIIPDTYE